ncbi:tetratricopeptide repeat protein [bacterium SCSIO 12643]|nr:tetratricopeptide repeat protein [bacterium SCSIO 12643]
MNLDRRSIYELLGIVLITLILYWPSTQFDFVNYDDQVYVLENAFVQSPTMNSLLDGSGTGNFHPLTMISLWLDHTLGNGSAQMYHVSNVLWHLLNTVLVFFLVQRILSNHRGVPFFVALLFAIHPMHIESVAWISSRKDLVYTFFYLSALIVYNQYLMKQQKQFLVYTLVLGVLSLLSKPAAITLPVALALLYYWESGTIQAKKLLELAPLFLGSIIIGLLTIQLQSNDAINDLETYSVVERMGFALYGIYYYTIQSIWPSGLVAMHPYPAGDEMTSISFIAPMLGGIIMLLLAAWGFKKDRKLRFGILFYLLNLVLMLQLVSIGRAIVAERYTYLSYLGLFLVFGVLLSSITKIKENKSSFYVLGIIVGGLFFFISIKQVRVWENSETLWSKAIQENPQDWYGYIGRGNYYQEIGKEAKALADFEKAIQVAPDQIDNYFNLGDLQYKMLQVKKAVATYSLAIEQRPDYEQAYINRGQFYIALQDGASALADFNQAIALNPNSYLAYNNRGNLYLMVGNIAEAVADFNKSIEINPDYANAWYNRGTALLNSDLKSAQRDLEQAVTINPGYFDAYNNLGSLYYQKNDLERASWAFTQALQINEHAGSVWLNLSVVKNSLGDYRGALESALSAQKEGAQVADSYLNQLRSNIR